MLVSLSELLTLLPFELLLLEASELLLEPELSLPLSSEFVTDGSMVTEGVNGGIVMASVSDRLGLVGSSVLVGSTGHRVVPQRVNVSDGTSSLEHFVLPHFDTVCTVVLSQSSPLHIEAVKSPV
ncbi:hypothetical protein FB192DRAFT_1377914 [Mucor lusitanicus]|uniref:Secreted protein n=1 Tax=Mucor circinelloides f. lusitanicus TaxID=29924 RepID=A0A8H4BHY0_MUCCL|nr:hypothetical protein FB192DRAFT_1377914 [Mucor lusitanicus]